MSGLGVVLFVIFILLAIGLHEFGHFATAKAFGIKVDRFFIGFGPRIWSTQKGETEYGIRALPFGGYVRIAGMNPFEDVPVEDRPRTFKAKPAWQRAIVLAAGSLTHFVIAFAVLAALFVIVGRVEGVTTTIKEVSASSGTFRSPAEEAGFEAGDRVVAVDGRPIDDWEESRSFIRSHPRERVTFTVRRGEALVELTATLGTHPEDGPTVGFLGVTPEPDKVRRSALRALGESGREIAEGVWDSLRGLGRVVSPDTIGRLFSVAAGSEERRVDDPTSIVGVGRAAGDLVGRGEFASLFFLFVGFNVFVGVANLLPLPPLDGGHLAVLGFEKLTHRDVDMRKLLPVSAFVVTVLVSLFVLLLYLDIVRPLPPLPG